MIRHIVIWNYADGLTDEQNKENAMLIKKELEGLAKEIKEIVTIEVIIDLLSSSTGDIMLTSQFKNTEDLNNYQIHPEHKRVSTYINSVTKNKVCMDYYE